MRLISAFDDCNIAQIALEHTVRLGRSLDRFSTKPISEHDLRYSYNQDNRHYSVASYEKGSQGICYDRFRI